jgi:hypothetical protein
VIEINTFPRQQRCLASPCAPVRCRAAGRTIAPLRLLNDGSPGGLHVSHSKRLTRSPIAGALAWPQGGAASSPSTTS